MKSCYLYIVYTIDRNIDKHTEYIYDPNTKEKTKKQNKKARTLISIFQRCITWSLYVLSDLRICYYGNPNLLLQKNNWTNKTTTFFDTYRLFSGYSSTVFRIYERRFSRYIGPGPGETRRGPWISEWPIDVLVRFFHFLGVFSTTCNFSLFR